MISLKEILMSKLYTTIFLQGFVIWLLICPVVLLAQDIPSLKDIKRSGKYYSGDSDGYDTLKVKEASRTDLMANISKQIKDVNSLNGKSHILVKYIQYLVKSLGDDGYTKVVAFVPIENVTRIIEGKEPLVVTEIKWTEASEASKNKKIADKSTEVPEVKPQVHEVKAEEQVTHVEIKNEIVPSAPKTLLESLVACNTGVELKPLLDKGKADNKLMYSTTEAFRRINSPENFYIVLIDPVTRKIVSFFDKGNSERKDLKSVKKSINIENDAKNLIQVWIQLF